MVKFRKIMSAVLHIKNMVCPRCIESVQEVLTNEGFEVQKIKLGEAEIDRQPTTDQLENISRILHSKGFELLHDKKKIVVDQVKSEIIKLVHHSENEILNVNLSSHLSALIGADYSSISTLFSSSEGLTIERFTILQKIEKVKELLSYGELTASEIAFKLGYSSAAHLSSQFKKETGMTPGQYKKLKDKHRNPLDHIGL
ncbi:helix-turn-helix domain-containing protein [Maribellus sediminis]|uniref:helix-turn-helix domain-containing protein n=1 Tax=Maribellus sediminis TaxID=2696285 RepID=UPI001F0D0525|nr:AraC family transcriptional regulator [Maribellus sediminis]